MASEDNTCMYQSCVREADPNQQLRVTSKDGTEVIAIVCSNHLHYIQEGTRQGKQFTLVKDATIGFPREGQVEIKRFYRLTEIPNG